MSQGVEGVEVSEEVTQQFLKVLRSRRYIKTIYKQIGLVADGRTLRKLLTIADFKSCSPQNSIVYHEKGLIVNRYLFTSMDSLYQVFRRALYRLPKQVSRRCGVEGFFAEVYATAMWFLDRGAFESNWWSIIKGVEDFTGVVLVPVAYDFVVDLDLKNNPWLVEDSELKKLKLFCDFMSERLGLEPSVLFSKGVQLRVSLHPLHLLQYERLGDEKWPRIVMKKLPEIHKRIALKLVKEFYERYGIKMYLDTQIYEPSRVMRLDLSIHSGIKAFSLPFKPYMLEKLTWDKIRELQRSPKYVMAIAKRLKGTWGKIIDPEKYLRILGFFLALGESSLRLSIELPKRKPLKTLTISGWRKIVDPILGEIEYDARLEGFGWVEVLVKEKIPIPDGRLAFCWAVLPVAIKGPKTREGKLPPLITREETTEWLRRCLKKYPDPEKSLEDYIEKLEYNLRYGDKYNIPTWKHLVEERTEDSPLAEVYKHVKYSVIYSLYKAGYIRLKHSGTHILEELVLRL